MIYFIICPVWLVRSCHTKHNNWALSNPAINTLVVQEFWTSILSSELHGIWLQKWGKSPNHYILPCVCGEMRIVQLHWPIVLKLHSWESKNHWAHTKKSRKEKGLLLPVQCTSTATSPALTQEGPTVRWLWRCSFVRQPVLDFLQQIASKKSRLFSLLSVVRCSWPRVWHETTEST